MQYRGLHWFCVGALYFLSINDNNDGSSSSNSSNNHNKNNKNYDNSNNDKIPRVKMHKEIGRKSR